MESTQGPLRIEHGDITFITKIEPWEDEFNVWFDCYKVPILFRAVPTWAVGDRVRIIFRNEGHE